MLQLVALGGLCLGIPIIPHIPTEAELQAKKLAKKHLPDLPKWPQFQLPVQSSHGYFAETGKEFPKIEKGHDEFKKDDVIEEEYKKKMALLISLEDNAAKLSKLKVHHEKEFPKLSNENYGRCFRDCHDLIKIDYCQVEEVTETFAAEFRAELDTFKEAFKGGMGRKVLMNSIDVFFKPAMQHVVKRAKEVTAFRCSHQDHECYHDQTKARMLNSDIGRMRTCPIHLILGKLPVDAETQNNLARRHRQLTNALKHVENIVSPKKALQGGGVPRMAAAIAMCVRMAKVGGKNPAEVANVDTNPDFYDWPGHLGVGKFEKGANLFGALERVVPKQKVSVKLPPGEVVI